MESRLEIRQEKITMFKRANRSKERLIITKEVFLQLYHQHAPHAERRLGGEQAPALPQLTDLHHRSGGSAAQIHERSVEPGVNSRKFPLLHSPPYVSIYSSIIHVPANG